MIIPLEKVRKDAISRVNRTIFSIQPRGDFTDFEEDAINLCNDFLILAATSLLVDIKPSMFFINLCRCAENWRRFSIISNEYYHRRPTLMYNAPFYAAIISNDKPLIQSLKTELPKQWIKGEEYEDQFHVTWLQMLLSENDVTKDDEVVSHLSSLEVCDSEGSKVILIKSLLSLDDLIEKDFWEQFETSLYEHIEQVEERAQSSTTPFTHFAAHRFLWFEGIAWLKLAQNKGFTFPSNSYKYCPGEALMPMTEPYMGDWIMLPDLEL